MGSVIENFMVSVMFFIIFTVAIAIILVIRPVVVLMENIHYLYPLFFINVPMLIFFIYAGKRLIKRKRMLTRFFIYLISYYFTLALSLPITLSLTESHIHKVALDKYGVKPKWVNLDLEHITHISMPFPKIGFSVHSLIEVSGVNKCWSFHEDDFVEFEEYCR